MNTIKKIFHDIMTEEGNFSLTRTLAVCCFVCFVFGSFYLLLKHVNWDGYSIFAAYLGGGGVGMQTANKFINSKYNNTSFQNGVNSVTNPEQNEGMDSPKNIGTK